MLKTTIWKGLYLQTYLAEHHKSEVHRGAGKDALHQPWFAEGVPPWHRVQPKKNEKGYF